MRHSPRHALHSTELVFEAHHWQCEEVSPSPLRQRRKQFQRSGKRAVMPQDVATHSLETLGFTNKNILMADLFCVLDRILSIFVMETSCCSPRWKHFLKRFFTGIKRKSNSGASRKVI
uniref:Uncharacterized protein n=1 Tax=Timema poppense TaxID=170557 RepID=A0A7R9DFH0_TIMPO|nr:unnamed protein product [Timema poppensis]